MMPAGVQLQKSWLIAGLISPVQCTELTCSYSNRESLQTGLQASMCTHTYALHADVLVGWFQVGVCDNRLWYSVITRTVWNLEACTISLRAGSQSVSEAWSIQFVVHGTRDGLTQNGNYYCQALPPVCLPSICLTYLHMTKSPRSSPSIFVYYKRSNTGGENSLETRLYHDWYAIYMDWPCWLQNRTY